MTERLVKVYTRFNRLWHWSQAASIMVLMFTGARLAGIHQLVSFQTATTAHTLAALALLLLWIFATFWLFTTSAWKQFIPTVKGLKDVAIYYAWGVFRGAPHPYRKVLAHRHNPLQSIAYLVLKMLLFPAIWISGLLYLGYGLWDHVDPGSTMLTILANIHILAAFGIASFVIVHLYLLTLGHGFREHVQPMISGFDRIDLTPEEEAYLESDEPWRLAHEKKQARGRH